MKETCAICGTTMKEDRRGRNVDVEFVKPNDAVLVHRVVSGTSAILLRFFSLGRVLMAIEVEE